jgi:hypothetical protein
MGTVITFPAERSHSRASGLLDEDAEAGNVIILPVIRIERHDGDSDGCEPGSSGTPRGRRKRS